MNYGIERGGSMRKEEAKKIKGIKEKKEKVTDLFG